MYTCWVITDGRPGMENQALGLAEEVGGTIVIKRVNPRTLWRWVAPYIRFGKKYCLRKDSDPLGPPWPELVIASGRHSILPSLFVKEQSRGKTKLVYVQNPSIALALFDAVVCPLHDQIEGPNVIPTVGSLHRIQPERLEKAKKDFAPLFQTLPSPRISILIGGPNKTYTMDREFARTFAHQLLALQKRTGASFLVTPSNRTPPDVIDVLRQELTQDTYLWDGTGVNPYFALLASADIILVTCDSVCMMTEVCATDKPVYLIPLSGGNTKSRSFHQTLIDRGRVRWWKGEAKVFPVLPFDENAEVGHKLKKILGLEEKPPC
jgi:mitochondrial fission protein ELM1